MFALLRTLDAFMGVSASRAAFLDLFCWLLLKARALGMGVNACRAATLGRL